MRKAYFLKRLSYLCISFFILETNLAAAEMPADFIAQWKVLGPFLSAPQEGYLNFLKNNGLENSDLIDFNASYNSAMGADGVVRWQNFVATSSTASFNYSEMNWEALKKNIGVLSAGAITYFYGEILAAKDEVKLIKTKNIRNFFVNNRIYFGESYAYEHNLVPVSLKAGINKILLKVGSHEDPLFEFKIIDTSSPLFFPDDFNIPHILNEKDKILMGVPIINATTDWQKNLMLKVYSEKKLLKSVPLPSIAPLSILKFPVEVSSEVSMKISIENHQSKILVEKNLALSLKNQNDPLLQTYKSNLDDSAQEFGLRFPKNYDPKKKYSLILGLHGANVPALPAIETYAPKDWAFVATPTNRRPHGFAWQDSGRKDALEVLSYLLNKFPIDKDKVYLTGHSMGGQGTWHIGLHHPDIFAGLAPSAAWINFEIYTPFFLQKSKMTTSDEIISFRNRVLEDSNNPLFLINAKNLPIFISQAKGDEIVPALHSRLFQELAKEEGITTNYREVNSTEHWYAEPKNEGIGYDAVDNPSQYEFLKSHPPQKFPKTLQFRLFDLTLNDQFYWIKVLKQTKVFSLTELKAFFDKNTLMIQSENIDALEINLVPELFSEDKIKDEIKIVWNEKVYKEKLSKSRLVVLGTPSKPKPSALKAILAKPFLIVPGTLGSKTESEELLHIASLVANRIWAIGNGYSRIVTDKDLKSEDFKNFNLIVIGNKRRNFVSKKYANKLPIDIDASEIKIGNKKFKINNLKPIASSFIFPNPEYRENLLAFYEGNSIEAERLTMPFLPAIERLGFGAPDFVIFNSDLFKTGWGAVSAAGFFSQKWDLSNQDYKILESRIH